MQKKLNHAMTMTGLFGLLSLAAYIDSRPDVDLLEATTDGLMMLVIIGFLSFIGGSVIRLLTTLYRRR